MVGFGPADLGSNPSRATSHIRNFINRLRFDTTMAIQSIAVLGAGQMGNGITQVAAAAGYNVTMIDIQQEYVDKGLATIERSLGKLVSKERMSQEDADATLARISLSTDRADCADCDLVVEACLLYTSPSPRDA